LEKTLTPKLVRDTKTYFGFFKDLSSKENPILNEQNSVLEEERSPFYLRGERQDFVGLRNFF